MYHLAMTDATPKPLYSYTNVEIVRVVDGDTIEAIIDLGFEVLMKMPLRIYGLNTPERGQPGYAEATAAMKRFLKMKPSSRNPNPTSRVSVHTIQSSEKYGRYLAEVFLADGSSLAEKMIKGGFGVAYFGGART